ncbi:DUF1549 domain-containing protein [Novipirellula sp.]|uniref:DUF1549 domain-containing protein n=1 Tax=Novipirellula sp. TaxID=2795430 RepID=UPI00356AC488
MRTQHPIWPTTIVMMSIVGMVGWKAVEPGLTTLPKRASVSDDMAAVDRIDALLNKQWDDSSIRPAAAAEDLQVLRRLTLALVGSSPSLEEVREFESDTSPDRLARWTTRLIADSRFSEYFAARLGDAFIDPVSEELKPPQRERFRQWLGESIQQGTGYDEIASAMIAGRGVFADHPATTFVASELAIGDLAAERLAARTSRAFLGQRIDCAQCHDHPFASWEQSQFEGLAAYFGDVQFQRNRVQDTRPRPFVIQDDRAEQSRSVAAELPFDAFMASDQRHQRESLASWVIHPENRRFRRAIANRVWGLMLGRPFISPVDDLPDPGTSNDPNDLDVLDILADDLIDHGDDLRRLIHVIVKTRPFGLASTHPGLGDQVTADQLEASWAVFPLTELGPHQMIRSMQQASSINTLRPDELNPVAAFRRWQRQSRFINEYGIAGDSEDAQASTIPHTVQRLSGNETRQQSEATLFSAVGRIAAISGTAEACLDHCYLACLTRHPSAEEKAHFLPELESNRKVRSRACEDIYWTLFNSAEFCWNH